MSIAASPAICREAVDGLRELQRLRSEIETLTAGLDEQAFSWRPAEGAWSVGECIGHLNATARIYLAKMPAAAEAARAEGLTGEGPLKRGLFGRLFLWALEPPARLKVKAPQPFLPTPGLTKDRVMGEFRQIRDEIGELMESSGDLDWARLRMPLPTIPAFKLRWGEICAVLLAHERRHLWQARRVTETAGFPGSS